MFAQAISSTNPVTASSIVSGPRASVTTELCPRLPASMMMLLARKRFIVSSLMPVCSGASTSLTMA